MPSLHRILIPLACAGALCCLLIAGDRGRRAAPDQGSPRGAVQVATAAVGREECTIGVASGAVTSDGRPLLWKVRDNAGYRNNEVYFNDSYPHRFVAVVNADGAPDSWAWMGVNEHGLAILNSNTFDLALSDGYGNGGTMREVLGKCRSVAEFVAYLDSTNGNRGTHANFGIIDSTGAAFMFEVSADTFWTYDAADAPQGYIVRANFACNDTAGVGIEGGSGTHRFLRSAVIIEDLLAEDNLSCGALLQRPLRDFTDYYGEPYPIPCFECGEPDTLYACFNTWWSICTRHSVSAAVIQGVDPGAVPAEPAYLSTMWTLLGYPATAIAVPYWPVGPAPAPANGDTTAPLCDAALDLFHQIYLAQGDPNYLKSLLLRDGQGGGIWSAVMPVEAEFLTATQARRDHWRTTPPDWATLLAWEDSLAAVALEVLTQPTAVAQEGPTPAASSLLGQNHPNPFNGATVIPFSVPRPARVELTVYDARGRRVAQLVEGHQERGDHTARWDATGLASGTYYLRLQVADEVHTRSCLYLK